MYNYSTLSGSAKYSLSEVEFYQRCLIENILLQLLNLSWNVLKLNKRKIWFLRCSYFISCTPWLHVASGRGYITLDGRGRDSPHCSHPKCLIAFLICKPRGITRCVIESLKTEPLEYSHVELSGPFWLSHIFSVYIFKASASLCPKVDLIFTLLTPSSFKAQTMSLFYLPMDPQHLE